jgi:hypothetical protein
VNGLYDYIIITCVSYASSHAVSSFPNHLPLYLCNKSRPLTYSSCCLPRRRSPSPPIVTSCSAPRQHAPSVVVLLRRSRTSRTATLGCNDRLSLHTGSSQSVASLISAVEEEVRLVPRRPTKRRRRKRRCHRPYVEILSVLRRPNMVLRLT